MRRARRAGRPVAQGDLIDEITRKPRDPESSPRLTSEEIRRVAVHEGGHALAAILGGTKGEDLTFISIIPRADGSLGFVARMPSERSLLTKREYLEKLEVILAGRAAEEVVFGEDGVTGGARQDLKVATRSALLMTTQYGLGPEGRLLWSDEPTPAQREEAGRIMAEVYAAIQSKLRARKETLLVLAKTLQERQELTGDQVRRLINAEADLVNAEEA
jgi:ATP-dependent Zn protease